MLAKKCDIYEESSVSVSNLKNGDTDVSTNEGDENANNNSSDSGTGMDSLSNVVDPSHIGLVQNAKNWSAPEGYRFLPEEWFKIKKIPPPLVSLSWLKLLSSDEESGEDSIPLAKLKRKIKKNKKLEKANPLRLLTGTDDSNALTQKSKQRRNKEKIENPINRKRGRPKKKPVEVASTENQCEKRTNDLFWDNESDSSNLDTQDTKESQVKDKGNQDINGFNLNYNEHDYFKPFEMTMAKELEVKDKEEKRKKRKSVVHGVKGADSKISFPCFECGKSFSAASTLKSHQRIHNGTLLICPECHRGFISKYLLKCHMRIHNGDLFMCHKCGRGFTTAELLKVHSRAHTGDRPFVCNICGKSFPTSSNMLQHKQIHNSEKKFLCSQCGSSFVQKRCLDYHMLTHSEKKNICNVCGKLWARKSDLIEHMRVHTGVKPYCCSICPQKFSQASSLKRHQLVHLDAKPISCVTCNRMFKCQEYYKRHLRKHEKEDYIYNDI